VDLRGDASSGKGEERAGTPFNRGDRISPMISGGIRAKLSRYHSLFEPRRLSISQAGCSKPGSVSHTMVGGGGLPKG
jgi:hypothetical protein